MKKKLVLINPSIVSEVRLSYKSKVSPSDRIQLADSAHAAAIFRDHWDVNLIELQEQFKILYLNQANRILAIYKLSTGGLTATIADPRLIMATALKLAACNMILAHSHPSGNLKPSRADEEVTYKIKEASKLFDIKLLDHIILSSETYFSFADAGLL